MTVPEKEADVKPARRHRARRCSHLSIALLLAGVAPLRAQSQGTLVGRVTAASGDPVAGACVSLVGEPTLRSCSGADGTYLLQGVPTGRIRVRADAPGFAIAEGTVDVLPGGVVLLDLELSGEGLSLEGVVVVAEHNRDAGVSVATVEHVVLTDQDGIARTLRTTVAGLGSGQGGGQIGTGTSVRARSPTTVTGRLAPLIYLNGLRLATSPVPTPDGVNQSVPILSTLNPADVERIEVFRGATATARYGMDAGSGVILIYTRQGRTPSGR